MKYLFNNVVFTPDAATKLTVDGEIKELPKRQTDLLKYFLDTNHQISDKNKILSAVWGPGVHTYGALTTALSRLNKVLAPQTHIETVRKEGHILNVDLTIVESQHKKAEVILDKPRHKIRATTMILVGLVLLSVTALAGVGQWLYPPIVYTVKNILMTCLPVIIWLDIPSCRPMVTMWLIGCPINYMMTTIWPSPSWSKERPSVWLKCAITTV
jgi:DNA-binding winged helix-turn-helix (wHTH) protein